MNFAEKLTTYLTKPLPQYSDSLSISLIDLTLLDTNINENDLNHLIQQSQSGVAAVCIFPCHITPIKNKIHCKLATVINFPDGISPLADLISQIDELSNQVEEIDYVFPYSWYLKGNQSQALAHCQHIADKCQEKNIVLKVILETGAFQSAEMVYHLSTEIIQIGCQFLKTSTGKINPGASLLYTLAMLEAIKNNNAKTGIKVSGGIKTPHQAYQYMSLAETVIQDELNASWFRIGASHLLEQFCQDK